MIGATITVSVSITQPSVGRFGPVQAPAVAAVGAAALVGSPPPPTWARFVTVPVAVALTVGVNVNMLLPPAAMTVPLVQVITCPAALHVQLAACAPPSVTDPAAMVMPVGNTSTTVTVPAVGPVPLLPTVMVYVVVAPA